MSEEFRDCFVGEKGYDALKKLMKSGNEFCTEIARCLQERYDAEVAYVRALRKNSDTVAKLAGKAKGSLSQAFTNIATQVNIESDAHNSVANNLLNQISIPMKNLAETQYKERKSIEEALNAKFKIWKDQKDSDNRYRTRQFEKCKEIEMLNIKMNEISKTTKNSSKDSAKEGILSSPLVRGCVLPVGRHASASEKVEMALRKADEDLEKIERKYHDATRDVEITRQACDAEMCRGCDQMQTMELDRITEMEKFIQIYNSSIQTLSDIMNQVSKDLYSVRVSPQDDIIVEARSSIQTTELEILLIDIYAENEQNTMSEQRRTLSLMHWMDMLRKDIDIQRRSRNESFSSQPSAPPHKSIEEESLDDDRSSSSDGAMCSTSSHSQRDIVVNVDYARDGSSSLSNDEDDDDGAMHHEHHGKHKKREKKKKEGVEDKKCSGESFIDRQSVRLLQCLYEASLYKIEQTYNRLKHLPESQYEHSQRFAKTFNDKGYPITVLRIPFQSLTHTPPSAPPVARYFVQSMPMYSAPTMPQPPLAYMVQSQAPPVGWKLNEVQIECSAPDNRSAPYPVLPSVMTRSVNTPRRQQERHVRALYPFTARHEDELTIQPGDIIMILERRDDKWCKGNLNGKEGLFPGNFTEEA